MTSPINLFDDMSQLHDDSLDVFNDESSNDINLLMNSIANTKYLVESDLNSFLVPSSNTENAFTLMHVNCRSLKANFSALENLILLPDTKLSAVAVTETW